MANICWMKSDIGNWAKALESRKGLLYCPKISWTLVHKQLKAGPEFSPTLTISFCPSPSHALYAPLTWRPTATLNETTLGSFGAQIWSPKDVKLEMLSRRAAFNGNTSLICYNCHLLYLMQKQSSF